MGELMGRWTDELVKSGEFVDAAGLPRRGSLCSGRSRPCAPGPLATGYRAASPRGGC
jgi:hypothetical protein